MRKGTPDEWRKYFEENQLVVTEKSADLKSLVAKDLIDLGKRTFPAISFRHIKGGGHEEVEFMVITDGEQEYFLSIDQEKWKSMDDQVKADLLNYVIKENFS